MSPPPTADATDNTTDNTSASDQALVLRGLSKAYRSYRSDLDRLREMLTGNPRHQDISVLADIDLEVRHGEVLGIVGRNGAGKSTLLKIIAGLLPPSAGSVEVNGRVAAILELGAAFHPEMSGRENVYLQAAIAGLERAEIDALFPHIAAFAEIGNFIERPVKTYSSGMAARLGFAVATAVDPDILIIDEALSVGDGAFARKSFDRIMAFRAAAKTILFCSHTSYHVESICDRVLWLDQGRAMATGEPEGVLNQYQASLDEAAMPESEPSSDRRAASRQRGRLLSVDLSADGVSSLPLRLRSGESSLCIKVRFVVDPALPGPSLAVGVSTADNRAVFGATSFHDQVPLQRDASGFGVASITFPDIPLLRGHYTVHVHLACENALHPYDRATLDRAIEVRQPDYAAGLGLFSVPHQWEVS